MLFSGKDLRRLIIPLVIEQILAVTIGMADTVMVSSVGEAAVSGISLVDTINVLLINIFSALAAGGAVVAAQYMGRKDHDNANAAAKQLILSTTAVSLLIMALSLLCKKPLLRLIFGSIEPDVMANAQTYFFLSVLSYPFLAVYNSGADLFRSMGNSKVSMFTSLTMNLANVSGNAVLIYIFNMGVAGAGIASLASRALGAVVMLVLLRNRNNPVSVRQLHRIRFQPTMIKNIMRIGVPNGLENSMFQIGKILTSSLIASFGTVAIAANAVANTVVSMECIPGIAIGLGMVTVVGQCVGAGEYEQAKRYTQKLMLLTYMTMAILNMGILLAQRPIVEFYHLSPQTMELARWLLVYHSLLCMVIWPASFTLPNAFRAANDVKFPMAVSIVSMWVCRIGMSYLLGQGFNMGVKGVWIAMTCDWLVRASIFAWRFLSGRWKNKKGV